MWKSLRFVKLQLLFILKVHCFRYKLIVSNFPILRRSPNSSWKFLVSSSNCNFFENSLFQHKIIGLFLKISLPHQNYNSFYKFSLSRQNCFILWTILYCMQYLYRYIFHLRASKIIPKYLFYKLKFPECYWMKASRIELLRINDKT